MAERGAADAAWASAADGADGAGGRAEEDAADVAEEAACGRAAEAEDDAPDAVEEDAAGMDLADVGASAAIDGERVDMPGSTDRVGAVEAGTSSMVAAEAEDTHE